MRRVRGAGGGAWGRAARAAASRPAARRSCRQSRRRHAMAQADGSPPGCDARPPRRRASRLASAASASLARSWIARSCIARLSGRSSRCSAASASPTIAAIGERYRWRCASTSLTSILLPPNDMGCSAEGVGARSWSRPHGSTPGTTTSRCGRYRVARFAALFASDWRDERGSAAEAATDPAGRGVACRDAVGVLRRRALPGAGAEARRRECRRPGRRRGARSAPPGGARAALLQGAVGAGPPRSKDRELPPRRGLRPARGALRALRAAVLDTDLRRGARRDPSLPPAPLARARRRLRPPPRAATHRPASPAGRGRGYRPRRRDAGRRPSGGTCTWARQLRVRPGRRRRPTAQVFRRLRSRLQLPGAPPLSRSARGGGVRAALPAEGRGLLRRRSGPGMVQRAQLAARSPCRPGLDRLQDAARVPRPAQKGRVRARLLDPAPARLRDGGRAEGVLKLALAGDTMLGRGVAERLETVGPAALFSPALVEIDGDRFEAIPLKLEYAHTRIADGDDRAWIERRFRDSCAALGTDVVVDTDGRLVGAWR